MTPFTTYAHHCTCNATSLNCFEHDGDCAALAAYYRQETIDHMKQQLTTAHEKIGVMKTALKDAEQFCTWLCEDSNKYPGTDAGIAAKSQRHDIRVVLEKVK